MAHVLLIDDDQLVRQTVEFQLKSGGHSVTAAAHGGEGLKAIERQAFDLAISDILMPEHEGIEFLVELRKKGHRLPVIMMTGGAAISGAYSDERRHDYLEMAAKLGATYTLRKPFTSAQLLALVEKCLAQQGRAGE